MDPKDVKKLVKEGYSEVAGTGHSGCSKKNPCCSLSGIAEDISREIGYSDKELNAIPQGANLGLGCGNPAAIASLKPGETVLDLGSGAGFDCFLASEKVRSEGRVIGVDMTPEMIERAEKNARDGEFGNVEFKLGEIEKLPIASDSIDVVVSNCVINLSPSKDKVFREIFRVLKKGGRFAISDIVLLKDIPDRFRESAEAYISCIAGAALKADYLGAIKNAGFQDVEILDETGYPFDLIVEMLSPEEMDAILDDMNLSMQEAEELADSVISIEISGIKMP
ncbi:arsenite methyltransferase [Methanolobus sp. ZRKC2]|uniref:arsenite methyltransferase n=1 Tax=Methanolobus sp. ZRKC2 TaxID=3125783 RepID=UPI00325323FF